jgi:hypothetical protein
MPGPDEIARLFAMAEKIGTRETKKKKERMKRRK